MYKGTGDKLKTKKFGFAQVAQQQQEVEQNHDDCIHNLYS